VAKTVTTLDVISSGRAILGIGAAWNQQEHESMGIAFPPVKQRFEMLEEALQICRSMFKSPSTTFLGNHYRLVDAMNLPQPLRPGGPPILIGGSGERKTLKLVAKYANACNLFGDVPTIAHKLSVLNHHCEQVARDPSEITKTRLGVLVIADTNADAKRESTKLIAQAADRGVPPQQTSGTLIAGDLNQVSEQVAEYLATGLDGMIFSIHNVYRLEPIIMAAEALEKLLKLSH
jgi:alkanesulfonate monooxygenase SsuD/methylene tetrahydromethanopterin reductase-like flavin-dependent oxidoreductase (luciferase family)